MKSFLKKTFLYDFYLWQLELRRKIRDRFVIPSYESKRRYIIRLSRRWNATTVFIETGTYLGDTVEFLKDKFEKLYSIELNDSLAAKAKNRFIGDSRIVIMQGDSAEQLGVILRELRTPATFWLDGHFSSEFFVGDEYVVTGKGKKDTPIVEELLQIKDHPVKRHVILIDDARLFNGNDDYPTKREIREFVREHLKEYSFSVKNDMIRILPKG